MVVILLCILMLAYLFDCPACRKKLYFPSANNSYEHPLQGICRQCKYKYILEQAEVVAFDSKVEALCSSTYAQKLTDYKRIYQGRLLSANKAAKSIESSTPGQAGDVTGKILRQLEELKALEAQKVSLSLLVEPQKLLNTKSFA